MNRYSILVLTMTSLFLGSTVHGGMTFQDSEGWGTVITFNEYILPQNEVVTNQYASLGVTFSADTLYEDPTGLWINFEKPITDVGFNIRSNTGNLLISTFLSGTLDQSNIFSFPNTDPLPTGFVEFTGIVFDSVPLYIPQDNGMNLDNLSFTVVLISSAVILGSIGLTFSGWRLRSWLLRKRRML